MKTNWGKLAIVGGVLTGLGFLLYRFAGGIQYTFRGIRLVGRDGLRLKVSVLCSVTNVNDVSAAVTRVNARILYGGYEVNRVTLEKPVTIDPGMTEELDLRFTISPGNLLSEVLRFFEKKDSAFQTFKLKGLMTGKIGHVPFAYPLNENLRLAAE